MDLRDGKVVRLVQGDYQRQINYAADPLETAQRFAAAGAKWMHIVDLDGAKEGRVVNGELIGRIIAASGLSVQVGGGIRQTQDIEKLLELGAARVVVGTRAMEDWEWFRELVHRPGMSGKMVLAIDARDGVVATRGWMASSGKLAIEVARQVSDWPLGALLYTDVAKDGMMSGPNMVQTEALAQAGKVAVIASGGVGNIEHIRALARLSVWGAIVGRSLYEGTVDLKEALEAARKKG